METATNHEPVGNYLHRFRVDKDLTIEAVAAATRIRASSIAALEANDHDRLPPPAYVKSFIRNYAEAVGADVDTALRRYRFDLEQREANRTQQRIRQVRTWALNRTKMAAGIIIGVFVLLRCTHMILSPVPSQQLDTPESAATTPAVSSAARKAGMDVDERLKLRVVAVKRTWLKVVIDGHRTRSYKLKPEDLLELEGDRSFNLMLGSADGLNIYLNDRAVQVFGEADQAVSLTIP